MEREKKSKPNGLRLTSTKKLKTMTLRECGKHVLMELCKNTGRKWIKKSNGSTDHTQNCPMCGITYEERVKRDGAYIEGSHVGVNFQPMLNHAFKQVFMTHQCDELTEGEILQKVMSIFHDLHKTAVKNQSCAIQPSCKWCNWYLGQCTVQQVDLLKNNPQAWRKHVLTLKMKRRKNTCSQPDAEQISKRNWFDLWYTVHCNYSVQDPKITIICTHLRKNEPNSYEKYCERNNQQPLDKKGFDAAIKEKCGSVPTKGGAGNDFKFEHLEFFKFEHLELDHEEVLSEDDEQEIAPPRQSKRKRSEVENTQDLTCIDRV